MKYSLPLALVVVVLALDQILKFWVKENMYLGEEIPMFIERWGWARLHFTENPGIAFGYRLFEGPVGKVLLTAFRLVLATAIFVFMWMKIQQQRKLGFIIALALIFAGAAGNIIDSVFYGLWFADINQYEGGFFRGWVVDMLYFPLFSGTYPEWIPFFGGEYFVFFRPVFNLADASITTGVLMILLFHKGELQKG